MGQSSSLRFIRLVIFIAAVIGIFLLIRRLTGSSAHIISPLQDTQTANTSGSNQGVTLFNTRSQTKKDPVALEAEITKAIGTTWNNYSVYVKDLNSPLEVGINETVMYTAASVIKIPILAALYTKTADGEVDLDDSITMQARDVQDYGTGSMRYDPVGTTYSIKTLARLMMQKSDNTAAYILSNHTLGLKTIQDLTTDWGLIQTDMTENKTSNKDIAILMEKIYTGNLVGPALTAEMLAFMKDSDFENRLPRELPPGTTIYHKIGTEVGVIHDAGIVEGAQGPYYIGIFVSDVKNETETEELMGNISRLVFDFMQ